MNKNVEKEDYSESKKCKGKPHHGSNWHHLKPSSVWETPSLCTPAALLIPFVQKVIFEEVLEKNPVRCNSLCGIFRV